MKIFILSILLFISFHCAGQVDLTGTWTGVDKNDHPIKLVFYKDSVRITNDVFFEKKWQMVSLTGKYSFLNPELMHILYYQDLKDPSMCEQEYFVIVSVDKDNLFIKRRMTKHKKETFKYEREK